MNHVAVILAAGGSTRLGRPKQLLERDGETLVHRVVRMALATGPARTFVVTGAHHDAVAAAVADLRCEIVFNPGWASGLAGSLARAAERLPADAGMCLVLGCDQPRLSPEHLQRLVGARALRDRLAVTGLAPPEALVCAASGYRDAIGIPACVPADWLRGIGSADGDRGFSARLRRLPEAQRAVFVDESLADDIDTPGHLAAAQGAGWIDPVG